jgi:hypothetical protein
MNILSVKFLIKTAMMLAISKVSLMAGTSEMIKEPHLGWAYGNGLPTAQECVLTVGCLNPTAFPAVVPSMTEKKTSASNAELD